MSDRKLLKKVRDGDKEALSDIIKQYYADIFRFCLYMIQNEEDSYDITQETFLKFMKYGTSYQRNNLKGYLLTIARNLCFDYQQRKKVAGKMGAGEALCRRHWGQKAKVLRPDRVPIPLRCRSSCRPSASVYSHGYHLPQKAHAGL